MGSTLRRLRDAEPSWIAAGVILEAGSLGRLRAAVSHRVQSQGMDIGWRASAEINLAGSVASKLLAAVGAGGVALSVWALRFAQRPGRAGVRALEFVGER
ncbi:MAG TPA: hypothetical protein VFW09_15245, partial [Solirubrobacteraceae bacterium]|nr:hypothetical protein [Solirubrobacteraceae bacterium]